MIELRPAKYLLGRLVPMDNNDKIPLFNLGSGTYDNTKFLRGDGTWAVPSGGGGSYVPYTGATGNVDLGEYGLSAGWIQIDTTPTTYTPGVGKLGWNNSDGTLEFKLLGGNVTLQIGQEQVARVVNKTDPLIDLLEANYQVVKIGGAQGNRLKVALAQANNDANSAETLGMVTETILQNQEGFITTSGLVKNINTTGSLQGETWADGDMLYLSGTVAGRVTKIKPTAPTHTVIIGYVVRAHITQGQIYVKIDNGYELGELHDVNTTISKTTPVDADSVLLQDTEDSNIWKKLSWANVKATLKTYFDTLYQAAGSYVPTSRTLTINSTTQDLSSDRSWTIDKASVGLGNVDNTSDANKPVSTAQAAAIALKQDTLVSGTNIKSINGNSLLGSGDLTISGSGNILATHVLVKPRSGFYYGTGVGIATNVTTMTSGVLTLSAFTPAYDLTVSELTMQVTTLLIGGLLKVVIYSDLDGVPYSKLFESATAITTTTGTKTVTGFSFTFNAGTTYWISMVSNGAVGVRALTSTTAPFAPIIANSSTTQFYQSWFIASSFLSLPATLTTPTSGNLNGGAIPYVIFRAT